MSNFQKILRTFTGNLATFLRKFVKIMRNLEKMFCEFLGKCL